MFAAPWFLTLLTASTPLPIACRVFDIFLLEVNHLLKVLRQKLDWPIHFVAFCWHGLFNFIEDNTYYLELVSR